MPQKVGKEQNQEMLVPLYDEREAPEPLPFAGLDKSSVVQDTKVFAASSISEKKCQAAMVKLLYLGARGETLTASEATDIFFGATKLFQSSHQDLRRLVYVLMKLLSQSAEHMLIATQILCKDISSDNDMYKANAIRVLRKITDVQMLGPGERFLQQSIVDKNSNVASAALVACLHFSKDSPDIVRKWSNEITEATKQKNHMVQYHAMGLLQKLKKSNKLHVLKQVQSVSTIPIHSPYAICLLIRMCTECLLDDFAGSQELYQFVQTSLRHGSEMVVFEAAKSICSLPNLPPKELGAVVLILQLYLSFHKPVLKFAALRLLNKMAVTHPLAVSSCAIDMETLLGDPNRNIGTLAITTILMTGSEHSIDRLMKQISKFLSDISDEFKSVVIESMKVLGKKFPHKHHVLLQFLSDALREEGGYEYKMSIVDTIATFVETSAQAKEEGLMVLCELIEDCEYTKISQRVLTLLGREGPASPSASKFVRFIYNRVLLEAPCVRAAAVCALAKFAAKCPPLRESIMTLLQRAGRDNDDEVRDRALLYMALLEADDATLVKEFITDVEDDIKAALPPPPAADGAPAPPAPEQEKSGLAVAIAQEETENKWALEMATVPQFKKMGKPFKSSEPLALTEKDVEFVVSCVKHCFNDHFVLHFKVSNTMEDTSLYGVQVKVSLQDDEDLADMEPLFAIPCKVIEPNSEGNTYVCLKRDPDAGYPTGSCSVAVVFAMEEGDDSDEFDLPEEIVFNLSDYMARRPLGAFNSTWDAMGDDELTELAFELDTMQNLQTAANEILDFYGFAVHDGTEEVKVGGENYEHTLLLSGAVCYDPPYEVLIKAKIALTTTGCVGLNLQLKGAYDDMRDLLAQSLVGA
eukprot:TRINITY_DN1290_c0_g1_i1.p1 TRINITY_DN1290_c0_g1~~TRINITY_DN1290_c0_g1_i1.p1  ORF type:complete len:892 (+),score=428.74 TRINITY_DN1290_c0_g1_i1:80-2677(+)